MSAFWIGFVPGITLTLAGYAWWCYRERADSHWWEFVGASTWAIAVALTVGWVLGVLAVWVA